MSLSLVKLSELIINQSYQFANYLHVCTQNPCKCPVEFTSQCWWCCVLLVHCVNAVFYWCTVSVLCSIGALCQCCVLLLHCVSAVFYWCTVSVLCSTGALCQCCVLLVHCVSAVFYWCTVSVLCSTGALCQCCVLLVHCISAVFYSFI